jgi:inner membrane transporter RhtA
MRDARAVVERLGAAPVWPMFVIGAIAQYGGAAVAVGLFTQASPSVVGWLRTLFAGVVVVAVTRPGWIVSAPRRVVRATTLGMATLGMNVVFYEAISRVDLGVAVAVEFVGPVAVAAVGTRGLRGAASLVAVIVGVVLVSGALEGTVTVGALWAVGAGVLWGGYIVLGARVSASHAGTDGRGRRGIEDLGVGLTVAAVAAAPVVVGVSVITGASTPSASAVALCVIVGVLSSAVPYVFDQIVLTRIGRARFAVLLALLPVTAALVGAITLRQAPSPTEVLGIAAVVLAILAAPRGAAAGDDGPRVHGVAPWTVMPPQTNTPPGPLVHLCPKSTWLAAHTHGRLEPNSLHEVGFIHLSALSQVHVPATALFAGRDDIVLLEIDPERVPAEIRWEDGDPPHPDGWQFPHLYGPLPVTAVTHVHPYRPDPDGTFRPRSSL